MDALHVMMTRRSPSKLTDPGPSQEVVEACLAAAVCAPDHGRLRPWRFLLISGERRVRFGEVLEGSLRRREPSATQAMLAREREKALRAPLILVAAAEVDPQHAKIPEIEQVLAAGAAAQNLVLSLHAHGFGCLWRTGAAAYDAGVKAALGLAATSHIIGFMYVGTIAVGPVPAEPPQPRDFVLSWP